MADRYSQVVNAPLVGTIAKQLGLPQPVALDRYKEGQPVVGRPRSSPAPPRRPARQGGRRRPRQRQGRTGRRRGQGQGAGLRRHRDRRLDRAGRAAALLLPRRRSPAAQRPRGRPRHAAGAGRLGRGPHRPAGAGGLHPLARQGDRRPRLDRAAGLRRAGRRGPAGVDAALPPLAQIGLRLRPGGARSARASPRARSSTGSSRWPARWRWSPAPRAGSAPRSPTTLARDGAARRRPRHPADGAPTSRPSPTRSAARAIELDITADDAPELIAAEQCAGGVDVVVHNAGITKDRTIGEDAGRALGAADGDQPLQRGADQRGAARRRNCSTPTAGSSASPRWRGSPATTARPTTPPRRPA